MQCLKKSTLISFMLGAVIVLCLTTPSWSAVPQRMNYQGLLRNGSENPVPDGSYSIVFTIYDDSTGGINLWSDTQLVTTSSGLFTVLLGSGAMPLVDSIFNDTTRYLGIKVGVDPEMSPRDRLVTVPYSYRTSTVDGASGGTITGNTSIQSDLMVSGNVGIGTASPAAKLHVENSTGAGVFGDGSTTGVQALGGTTGVESSGGTFGGRFYGTDGGSYGVLASGITYGIDASSSSGTGVKGFSSTGTGVFASGGSYGVYALSTGTAAVYGDINGNLGTYGGYFQGDVKVERNLVVDGTSYSNAGVNASSASGPGVIASGSTSGVDATGGDYGIVADGGSYGVYGSSSAGYGVFGTSTTSYGVYGTSSSSYGVYGYSASGTGVYGLNSTGRGVFGSSAFGPGVVGIGGTNGVEAEGTSRGIYATGGNIGVLGVATIGGVAHSGIYGSCNGDPGGIWSGYFDGAVSIALKVSSAGGGFKIDHPIDPANKYLYHSFVESPDMKNIYDGVVTLDAKGIAIVTLPDWFDAINSNFRYQLTAIGAPGPSLYIAQEIVGNQFKIAGGAAGMKVSWQVTGNRQDAYAKAHRIQVEEEKPANERGKYLHAKDLGLSETLDINYEMMKKIKEGSKPQ